MITLRALGAFFFNTSIILITRSVSVKSLITSVNDAPLWKKAAREKTCLTEMNVEKMGKHRLEQARVGLFDFLSVLLHRALFIARLSLPFSSTFLRVTNYERLSARTKRSLREFS